MSLSVAEEQELIALEELEAAYQSRRGIYRLFPATGPLRRELYAKHMEFYAAGALHRQRLFLGANRIGKSKGGGFEDVLHLTGLYDEIAPWWTGKRFSGPVKMWVCGTTDEKIKETVQEELLGPPNAWGTGLIPGDRILRIERAASPIKDLVDMVRVKHKSGGASILAFKSYKQGRAGFEGTYQHVIHGDEEMPLDVHTECLLRTTDTSGTGMGNGLMLLTFTPLNGLSDTVMEYLPDGQLPDGPQEGSKYVVNAGWDDVPHLDEATKAELKAAIPAYQVDARTRGLPVLGAGVIFPIPEEDFLVEPFALPKHWLRCYGMDVGWNRTACPWGAYDREADTWYLYHEHYRGQAEPSIHAAAIKDVGAWIPGVIDPAANGRSQDDGTQLLVKYRQLGLHLTEADNARETGIYEIWERLSTGRLKVFTSLANWRKECRLFRRDDKGRIVNEHDFHLMAATRYLMMTGKRVAKQTPVVTTLDPQRRLRTAAGGNTSWME